MKLPMPWYGGDVRSGCHYSGCIGYPLSGTSNCSYPDATASRNGWRYTGLEDLSQLGWQAMVLDSGNRAGIAISDRSIIGVQRFLQSVQVGRSGGLASYRKGEAPTHTMTAEALATRILIGDKKSQKKQSRKRRLT